jgi:hypothetical protein
MKPVGKPDARNPHVRFDERGRETSSLLQPRPSSTLLRDNFFEPLRQAAASPLTTASNLSKMKAHAWETSLARPQQSGSQ